MSSGSLYILSGMHYVGYLCRLCILQTLQTLEIRKRRTTIF